MVKPRSSKSVSWVRFPFSSHVSSYHILKLKYFFRFVKYRKKTNNVVLRKSYNLIKHNFFFKNLNKKNIFNINFFNLYHYDFSKINKIKKSKRRKRLRLFYDRRIFRRLRAKFFFREYSFLFYRELFSKKLFQVNNSISSVKKRYTFWKNNVFGAYMKFCSFSFFANKVKNNSRFLFLLGCSHPIGNFTNKFFTKDLLEEYNYSKIDFNFSYDITQYMDIESNFFNCLSNVELFFIDNGAVKPQINSVLYSQITKATVSKLNVILNIKIKNYVFLNLKMMTTYIYDYLADGCASFVYGKDKLVRSHNILYGNTWDATFLLDKKKIEISFFKFYFLWRYKTKLIRRKLYASISYILLLR